MRRRSDSAPPELLGAARGTRGTGPAPSGTRRSGEPPASEPWRDVLLRLSTTLPIDTSCEELGRLFLDGVAMLFPSAALAIRIAQPGGGPPTIVCRLPPSMRTGPAGGGPRLFPACAEEQVYELKDGDTLHVARHRPHRSPSELAERAAAVLEAALGRARTLMQARASSQGLEILREQVIQTEKLASLGEIVAGVVHELNNPLSSIIAYSDYLTKKLDDGGTVEPGQDAQRLRRIGEAAQRILRFTRDLVAYARPTGDERRPVELEQIIERALGFCEHEFADGQVEVHCVYASLLSTVSGSPGQLTQVFVNLFTNAAHAMSGGSGELRVNAKNVEGGVRVDVSDTGDGIPPEALPQIFQPFFTTKTSGRGTGLGLSIVRTIVEAHGGTIEVESEVGRGTTFSLTLRA